VGCDTVHGYLGPFANLDAAAWMLRLERGVMELCKSSYVLLFASKEISLSGVRGCRRSESWICEDLIRRQG
jgi:hypothetical protein